MSAIIISPSGKFYGSEQVLIDYLNNTSLKYDLFIKGGDKLANHLQHLKISFTPFQNVPILYAKIAFKLFFSSIKIVYINEGGHIKYAVLLAKIFPKKKIVVHIRIVEDTYKNRFPNILPENINLIAISRFIYSALHFNALLLYDLYDFKENLNSVKPIQNDNTLNVAIIGRISYSKGIETIFQIAEKCQSLNIYFHLYGLPSSEVVNADVYKKLIQLPNIKLKGFVEDKQIIYGNSDIVLHLAKDEPLGRIFLEAIDFGIPFIGINSGGIGEIASLLNAPALVVTNNANLVDNLITKILEVKQQKEDFQQIMFFAKQKAKTIFSVHNYVSTLNKLLSE